MKFLLVILFSYCSGAKASLPELFGPSAGSIAIGSQAQKQSAANNYHAAALQEYISASVQLGGDQIDEQRMTDILSHVDAFLQKHMSDTPLFSHFKDEIREKLFALPYISGMNVFQKSCFDERVEVVKLLLQHNPNEQIKAVIQDGEYKGMSALKMVHHLYVLLNVQQYFLQ